MAALQNANCSSTGLLVPGSSRWACEGINAKAQGLAGSQKLGRQWRWTLLTLSAQLAEAEIHRQLCLALAGGDTFILDACYVKRSFRLAITQALGPDPAGSVAPHPPVGVAEGKGPEGNRLKPQHPQFPAGSVHTLAADLRAAC